MSQSLNAQQALWLDPFLPLEADAQVQLAAAGLRAIPVTTLQALAAQVDSADLLVLRLADTGLLQEVQALLSSLGCTLPIVCRVERRSMELVVDAMRLGALHVVPADDWSAGQWHAVLALLAQTAAQSPAAGRAAAKASRPARSAVYVDPVSQHLLALAQRVAVANVTTLIEGPTGAGKEVLARVLHESSGRSRGPFVALNCAALPEHLIEDMLMGHEKGAFTGAHKEHRGMFEQAQGGTLFLDEIAEMPIHLQAKLLRILQERQVVRLGGERPIELDVRVVVATNKDLRASIAAREFREDLYFRISTFKLRVPPLRERPGDILPLVARLLARHAPAGLVPSVDAQAQACLQAYPWPGNVRELENVVLRALVLCTAEVITTAHLMFDDAPLPDLNALATAAATVPATAAVDAAVHVTSAAAAPAVSYPALAPVTPAPQPAPVMRRSAELPASMLAAIAAGLSAPVLPQALKPTLPAAPAASLALPEADGASLQDAVKSNEHQLIMAAIQSTYSRMEAARKLGISPRTLRYKLAKLKEPGTASGLALNSAD